MSKPASALNVEFDSRIVRVSIGPAGMIRPSLTTNGLEKVYCVHCGKPSGAVTADLPPAARHDPAPLVLCDDCQNTHGRIPGFLPSEAISFSHRERS